MAAAASDEIKIPRTLTYTAKLVEEFKQLRADAELSDVKVKSGTESYSCHKVILAGNSPFMKAVFRSGMSEASKREISIKNISPDVMEIIIEYMYTGEASIPPDQLHAVVEASDYLQMLELKELCLDKADSVFKPSNAISWYKLADKLDVESLKSKLSEILSSSLAEIAKYSEFLELSVAEMNGFISDAQKTGSDADELLEATLDWVDHKADQRVGCMKNLVQNIDLSECSLECLDAETDSHEALLKRCPEVHFMITKKTIAGSRCGTVRKKRRNKAISKSMVAIIGGQNSDNLNEICWEMNACLEFVELCRIPQHNRWLSVCALPDGFILTGGVGGCILCSMFVLSTKSWKQLEPLQSARFGHGSLFLNGRIFLFGGWISDTWSNRVESMKCIEGETWTEEPEIPSYLIDPEVANVDDSIFLLNVEKNELFRFDVEAKSWSSKAKLPGEKCWGVRMVSVGGQLLVAGGEDSIFAQYSPGTDTWSTGSRPTLVHHYGALVSRGRKVYLIGGKDEDRVEEYDLDTETWSLCDSKVPKQLGYLHAV